MDIQDIELPEWFEKIKKIQEEIEWERDWWSVFSIIPPPHRF